MAQARFSVRTAAAEGIEFWRTNWRKVAGALVLASLVGIAVQLNMPLATEANPLPPQLIVGAVLVLLSQLPAQAALYRIALSDLGAEPPERNGPFGLQWRMLETNLLVAGVLIVLLIAVMFMVAAFVMLALAAGFASGLDAKTLASSPEAIAAQIGANGLMVMNLVMLAFMVGLIILTLRLSLVQAATAAARRTQVFSSMRLTKGALLPIFGTMMLINLPLLLIQVVAIALARNDPFLITGVSVILAGLSPFFLLPISVGAMAHIYRRLSAAGGAA
ncbi:MAG: hypothetical protein KA105_01340 [Caulobacter sp.]|jgi:hypothetical protein|nr:hypothetical protein [Caulobacter sp.]